MNYKLIPINLNKTNIWILDVTFIHGDYDSSDEESEILFTEERISFESEQNFLEKSKILMEMIKLKENNFSSFLSLNERWTKEQLSWLPIPWDKTSDRDFRAEIHSISGYYYDKYGETYMVKFL